MYLNSPFLRDGSRSGVGLKRLKGETVESEVDRLST